MTPMQKLKSLRKRLTTDHYDGFMLPLNMSSWGRIDKKIRNEIRKAENSGITVRSGDPTVCHFCEHKNRFGGKLYDFHLGCHVCYTAEANDCTLGRILVDFAEPLIIYRCACNTVEGKKLNVNSLLIWNMVKLFNESRFRYFVLGYSSIQSIEHFKSQFGVLKLAVPARFWDFLDKSEEVRAYVIFEKRCADNP